MHHNKHAPFNRWITMLYRLRDHYLEHELHPYGIGSGQLRILLHIHHVLHHDHREVIQTKMAHHLHLDKGAMTRAARKLEEQGYIKRERAEHDHREYKMSLTDKAHEKIKELRQIQRRWGNALSHDFSRDEQKQALAFLERMAQNADALVHAIHQEKQKTKDT